MSVHWPWCYWWRHSDTGALLISALLMVIIEGAESHLRSPRWVDNKPLWKGPLLSHIYSGMLLLGRFLKRIPARDSHGTLVFSSAKQVHCNCTAKHDGNRFQCFSVPRGNGTVCVRYQHVTQHLSLIKLGWCVGKASGTRKGDVMMHLSVV